MSSQIQERWIKQSFQIQPLPDKRYLLYSKDGKNRLIVPESVLGFISLCEHFRTFEDHATHIVNMAGKTPGMVVPRPRDIIAGLTRAADAGLLKSIGKVVSEIRAHKTPERPGSTAKVGIRTCNRPGNLRRLLESFVLNEAKHNNSHHYEIIDDSSDSWAVSENKKIAEKYQAEGLNVCYITLEQQNAFSADISERYPDFKAAIEFLFGWRYGPDSTYDGRPVNHLIARNANSGIILCDDDMEAYPRTIAEAEEIDIAFASGHRPTWFPKDKDSALALTEKLNIDPIEEHFRELGKNTYQFLKEKLVSGQDLTQLLLSNSVHDQMLLTDQSQIKITSNGTAGDPGTSNNQWLLTLKDDSRARFLGDRESFNQALTNRLAIVCHRGKVLSTSAWCMPTTMIGLDLTEVTAAFWPIGRGSDDLYGALSRALYPYSHTLHHPWTLDHYPTPLRHWDADLVTNPSLITPPQLLIQLTIATQDQLVATSPTERLAGIANAILDLSEAPDNTLAKEVEYHQTALYSNTLREYDALLRAYPEGPDYWRDTITALLNNTQQRLMRPPETSYLMLAGNLHGSEKPLEKIRNVLKIWGQSLSFWPKLWQNRSRLDS